MQGLLTVTLFHNSVKFITTRLCIASPQVFIDLSHLLFMAFSVFSSFISILAQYAASFVGPAAAALSALEVGLARVGQVLELRRAADEVPPHLARGARRHRPPRLDGHVVGAGAASSSNRVGSFSI